MRQFVVLLLAANAAMQSMAQNAAKPGSAVCPGTKPPCEQSQNPKLYPVSFGVFGARENQVFTTGQYLVIVARFDPGVCKLIQPKRMQAVYGVQCKPVLTVTINSTDSGNIGSCFNVEAARSANDAGTEYSINFADDSTLTRVLGSENATYWNHFAFPIAIVAGMASDHVKVTSLIFPPSCEVPDRNIFIHENLIPLDNDLLQPRVSIDTAKPIISNVYSSKSSGNYTVGDTIYIICEFSREVSFSELPGQYSQVRTATPHPPSSPAAPPHPAPPPPVASQGGGEGAQRPPRRLPFQHRCIPAPVPTSMYPGSRSNIDVSWLLLLLRAGARPASSSHAPIPHPGSPSAPPPLPRHEAGGDHACMI
jgi:hypothetical protein